MSEATVAFFAMSGWAFWVLLLIETIILCACVEYEAGVWSVISLVVAGFLVKTFGNFDVFSWVYNNPWMFAQYVGYYFVVGTFYCILKWWSWAKNEREKYDERKKAFLKHRKISDGKIPENLKLDWERCSHTEMDGEEKVANSKWKIYMWIVYWPWSGLWTLIHDPIKRILKFIYRQIKGLLKNIYDRQFADVKSDFLTPEERDEAVRKAEEDFAESARKVEENRVKRQQGLR
jgi:hypothetical protein